MGGGDLNLKKSWHPSTLRNIERVWKAEQKHEAEKQKIEQLQKELAEERAREEIQQFAEDQGVVKKKDEKLDWMYQGPAAMVNREEYLMGRKIDKTFETLQMIENGGESHKDEGAEDRTTFSCQNLTGTATVDLANKIREDPLFNIMKKEKEERKNLLTNPVKMKQLQQLLKASLGHKKSKKSKKSKKKHHGSDSEEEQKKHKKHQKYASSESDEEISLSKKMKNNLKHKIADQNNFSSERKKPKYEVRQPSGSEGRHKSSYVPSSERDKNYRSYEEKKSRHPTDYRESEYYSSRESYHHSSREPYHSSRETYKKSSRQFDFHASKESNLRERDSYKNGSVDSRSHSHSKDQKAKEEKKKKLSNEERERLLQEMQDNAVWREEQRKRNTQRYKEEDEKEEMNRIDTSDFLKPMLSKTAGKGSLENRIKQKIFTIQRSDRAMDKNFARRD
ncbi:Pre-mRNA-splicing factor CWC25 like protein [Argiope bruennichi]|uniref:Pre-mRNA-splicing factor CWC25 like protein n=1 Tax=Argiope bruennichi TaxID=94029 RepID=A0A8T0EAD6_ARGBR|nr:Pre-mRNA-splicing factor CWC25 like protein [Argiope bruennichi]